MRLMRCVRGRAGLAAALCLLTAGASGASADAESMPELIYKVGKFVRWPDASVASAGGRFRLCILGNDEFGSTVDGLAGLKLQGQVVAIERLSAADAATSCQIVFIGRSESGSLDAILNSVAQSPVLTVSDIDGFAAQGGMVGFSPGNDGIKIEINSGASRRAGLDIGAQLMQRATLVADERSGMKP